VVVHAGSFTSTEECKEHFQLRSQECNTNNVFADDTTFIGMSDEIEEGKQIIEKVMGEFEERTNESKEEKMEFKERGSEEIRMLGAYMGNEHDTNMRIKRATRT